MSDYLTIFLFFVFACLGAAAGAIIQRAQNRRLSPPPPQPSTSELPADSTLASEGDVEILRAWRTLSGRVWLEMDRTRLNGKESLQPEQRRRLVGMLLDLRPWLENPPAVSVISEVQSHPAVASLPLVNKGMPDFIEAKPVPELKSIVEQIDDVFQAKLLVSPLKDRDIHLTEGSGGEVLVKVGLNKYEGIDAVPDPIIKALIHQAVSEWEKLAH